jgi:hypothetical protein
VTSPSTAADAPQVEAAEDVGAGAAEHSSRGRLAAVGLTVLVSYLVLPIVAVFDVAGAVLGVAILTQLADIAVINDQDLRAALARAQLGVATRTLLRDFAAVALVLAAGGAHSATARAEALLLLAVPGTRLLYQLLMVPVRRRIVLPVITLNIDLEGIRSPAPPPVVMTTRLSERLHGVALVAIVGAAVAVLADQPVVAYVVAGLIVGLQLGAVTVLAGLLFAMRGATPHGEVLAAVNERVRRLHPEVVLYHSGDADSTYQANMWLSTVDGLHRPALIVLRERTCFATLGRTTTPVVCIPGSVEFMTFPLPDVRVAMYTANVGKTIHLLREPGIRHVFVGHGDSDKSASSNPFSKVYSEIWVAGEGGRDRYRKAAVGVRDEDIVDVGRPQLGGIEVRSEVPAGELTALYAPTWEGWISDPAHTSLMRTGPALVEQLVALPDVRVVYKPHPFTGTVSAAAGRADAAIRATIARAARESGRRHEVVEGPGRSLYDCFNEADILVADISSVLSDFIQSQKPYVVPNLTAFDEDRFRVEFPSASAAYLLDPRATRIGSIVDLVQNSDPMAAERRRLKHYLLGPDEPDATTRFAAAVDAAFDRAVTDCPVRPTLTVSTV